MSANQNTQEASVLNLRTDSPKSASSSVVTIVPYQEGSSKPLASGKTDPSVSRVKAVGNPCARLISGIKPASSSSSSKAALHTDPKKTIPRHQINYKYFTPEIVEILKHQKDSRYNPVPKNFPDPPPNSPKDKRTEELTYVKCNECEVAEGGYTNCTHLEDEGPFDTSVNVDRIGQCIRAVRTDSIPEELPLSIKDLEYEMFKSDALSGLLSENTDEHASHFVVFTSRGTLLGYSANMSIRTARKVAALAGLTWRANETALRSGAEGSVSASSALLKTLAIDSQDTDGKLTSMVAEAEGMMAAVCYIKETILVAALAPVKTLPGKKDKEAKAEGNAGSSEDESAASPTTSSGNEEVSLRESPDKDTQDNASASSIKGKAKESDEGDRKSLRKPELGLSQQQILTWKAEGMAEALREDLHDFKLPEGAY